MFQSIPSNQISKPYNVSGSSARLLGNKARRSNPSTFEQSFLQNISNSDDNKSCTALLKRWSSTDDPVALFKIFVELRLYAPENLQKCFRVNVTNGLVKFELLYSTLSLPDSAIPYKTVRLEDIDLSSWSLKGVDLGQAYLTRANLSNCTMESMSLTNCCLSKASCYGMKVNNVALQCTFFDKADLREAVFNNIDARNIILNGADCSSMKMQNANMVDAILNGTIVNNAQFFRVNMNGAQACQSPLFCKQATFIECQFDFAQFPNADFFNSCLPKCSLKKANLSGANMRGVDLGSAWLKEANMTNAVVKWANLLDLNAEGIIAWGADFDGVNAELADFSSGRFFDDSNNEPINVNFRNANLKNTYFLGADLRYADFRGADLINTNFTSANLTGANFTGAILNGADFSYADCTKGCFNNSSMINCETDSTQWYEVGVVKTKTALKQETIAIDNISGSDDEHTLTPTQSLPSILLDDDAIKKELEIKVDELNSNYGNLLPRCDSGVELESSLTQLNLTSSSDISSDASSSTSSKRTRASSSLSSEVDSVLLSSVGSYGGHNYSSLEELKNTPHAEMAKSTLQQQLLECTKQR